MASLVLPLFSALLLATTITESEAFSTTVKEPYLGHKLEKLTHFHFYMHDIFSEDKPTSVVVATSPTTNSSATTFGLVAVVDDVLTVGAEITSEEVGRVQGLFASGDQNKLGLLMAINFVFTKGEFSGSTFSMSGRNLVISKVREMPIFGGTGAFRVGRGYAQVKTFTFNVTSGDAVVTTRNSKFSYGIYRKKLVGNSHFLQFSYE